MIMHMSHILLATAVVPFIAALGVCVAQLYRNRRWAMRLTVVEMLSGMTGSVVLAALLRPHDDAPETVNVILWNWFSFSTLSGPSMAFGLEATALNSCLLAVTSVVALVLLWKGSRDLQQPLSDDCIMCAAALYIAGMVFIYSPNLPQSLIGWVAISVLTMILFRLSKQNPLSANVSPMPEFSRTSPVNAVSSGGSPAWRTMIVLIEGLEWVLTATRDRLTKSFPSWVLEEVELIERGPISVQLLAAMLGTSAILLTWMLLSCQSSSLF
jgi:hypothetical protein